MSAALSKRQQARNERALQDLIKTVPGNNLCADCQARNPGWASWSLGIFLCMRCAALHRKLGTHITKVKSLSMDSWSTEQVENMKRHGNIASNRVYNPTNARPPIPIDADEADSAMERFIRQKYQNGVNKAREPVRPNHTGSTGGSDEPPPLPPKPGSSRFGFRSASSIFPLSSKSKREAAANARHNFDQQEAQYRRSPSPPPRKPSRIFRTTSISNDSQDDLEQKLNTLRDMGFRDDKRNSAVLKGFNGNLEKSIETLVRLGEGQAPTPVPKENGTKPTPRARTPLSSSAGISFGNTEEKVAPSKASSNPWDMLDAPTPPTKPQSSQSTGNTQPQSPVSDSNPYHQQFSNSNPFGLMPSQSHVNLNQSFQNMAISPTASQPQPLFPNHTGGFPGPQPTPQQLMYQQSMTPPVPSMAQQYYPPVIYENPTPSQQNTSYNPFMQPQQQQQIQPQQSQPQPQFQNQQPPMLNTNVGNNPFLQQPRSGSQSTTYNSPMDSAFRSPTALHSHQNLQQSNPFLHNNSSQPQLQQQVQQQIQNQQAQQQQNYQVQQQQYYQQFQQPTQPVLSQQPFKADNRSIMDLFNHPQLAPTPMVDSPQQQLPDPMQNQNINMNAISQNSQFQPQQQQQQQQMGIVSPVGSKNPFMLSGAGNVPNPGGLASGGGQTGTLVSFAPVPATNGPRHVSQESVSIDAGGWQNGRHSPDAWGTISARSVR
ncbi:hypothetical protein HYFRA_00006514 [Hymenoscyphus fraxineus]|uniref:ArfGap-domain-containing protein n=1 Tax=Hymenoscyphus fraxineus TaxID=746836 RepID=A0A9N9KPS0_9HELO|nr:hypothetical protein HYFRA_00006514 [Hymenoscyphus fraxineus]